MARVPTLDSDDLPEEYRPLLAEDDDAGFGHVLNLNRALANNPPLLRSFILWSRTLLGECGLSLRERELVILAVAGHLQSEYEWHQHAGLAREANLSPAEISAIRTGDTDAFEDREASLLAYVRATMERNVDVETHGAVASHIDDESLIGVVMLVSHFLGTAHVIDALDLDVEGSFVGWDLAGL